MNEKEMKKIARALPLGELIANLSEYLHARRYGCDVDSRIAVLKGELNRREKQVGWHCPHGFFIGWPTYREGDRCDRYHPKE